MSISSDGLGEGDEVSAVDGGGFESVFELHNSCAEEHLEVVDQVRAC